MAQIMAQTCEFSCKEEATLYCKVCKQFLCIDCKQTIHDKFPKCKDHAVVNIHQEGNCVFRPHPVCETHKDTFVFYCCKCECLTCAECMTSTHNEHKTEKIKSVADARRHNVNQIVQQLKTKVDIVKKKLETIDTEQSIQIQADCLSYVKKVEETVDDLHMIVDRHKLIPLTTASDFKDIENEDLGRKRVFFRRRHDETAIRLLKFENLLKETHDSTFLTEWKALQTDVQMNNEETDDPLVAPRRIESFNQKKLTKFVIDEIDEKFQMKLREQEKAVARLTEGIGELRGELTEKVEHIDDLLKLARELKEKKNELVEENDKLKTEIKERKVQETSKLKEKEKRVNVLLEENDKLKSNIKGNQEEIADKKKMLNVLLEENVELKSCIQIKQYDLDSMPKLLQGLNEKERMIKGLQDENNTLTTEYKQREMKANSQLKEKEKRMHVLLEENDKLKYKIQINQEELKEKEKSMNVLLEENDKLKYKIQINQEEEREENTIRQKTKLKETACIDYKDSRYKINPVLKQMAFKGKIIKILKERKIVFNPSTLDMTVSVEQLTSLNQQIIHEFGVDICIFEKEVPDLQAEGTSFQTKLSPLKIKEDKVQLVAEFQLPYMRYRMLQFFCPECHLFKGSPTYENGVLRKLLQDGEKEDEMKAILHSKSLYFQSLTTFDVPMPEGWTVTDLKLKEVETELNIISSEIFCFRSKDAKTLTLKGNQYEKLQMAKTKCEFILGIKQKGRGGRRARAISTDPSFKKEGNEQIDNKSFSQSVTPSRSSFSQSFSGGSSSPSVPPSCAATFKTSEGLLIHVYVGNLLNLKVDCIVNAANETLSHGGGVADVISRAAGYGFQQESDDYIQQNGQLNVTDCCTTSAGSLSYQCVIHAVGPRWYTYTDKRKCANDLEETVKNCFKVAENKKMTSVAIPAISSGIFGVPREVCCTQYCKAVKNYSNIFGQATCLREIHFMDKDAFMVGLIQKEFKQNLNIDQSVQSSGSRVSNPSGHSLSKNDNTPTFARSLSDDAAKAGKYSGSTNGKNSNPSSSVKQEKFQKQYMTAKGFKVHVVQDDITKMCVDVIICPQDDFCLCTGGIAKAIANASNERYRTDVLGMKTVKRCEVKKIAASPLTLPFKYVLHTVAPRWDKDAVKDNAKFMKELGLTIRNIIKHCSDSKNISTAAIPILGIGADGYDTPYVTYASILSKEITQELQNDKFSMQELYIVTSEWGMALAVTDQLDKEILFSPCTSFQRRKRHNKDNTDGTDEDKDGKRNRNSTTGAIPKSGTGKLGTTVKGGNLENCVICMDTPDDPRRLQCGHVYCHSCISQHFKINNPVCPTCGSIQGVVTGNQPPGTMKTSRRFGSLAGYPDCERIEIEYIIDSGRQGPEHNNEGRKFEGIRRIEYLPDNRKGQLVAKMLRVAFDRKLVFTIGDSRTTGKQGVVTWNDIHHKTNPKPYERFGYPDDSYLDRVIDELSAKGVTEKDIGPNTPIY